jgi:hypothetical protein
MPRGVEAIQRRHADIQYGNIRLELIRFGDSVPSVRRFGHDLPVWLLFNQRTEPLSNNVMIVRK